MPVDIIADYPYFEHKKLAKGFVAKRIDSFLRGDSVGIMNVG